MLDSLDSAIRRKKRIYLRIAGRPCRNDLGLVKRKHVRDNTAGRMERSYSGTCRVSRSRGQLIGGVSMVCRERLGSCEILAE